MIHKQSVFEPWPIESESVQAVITSPPYYALRKYSIPDVIIGVNKKLFCPFCEISIPQIDNFINPQCPCPYCDRFKLIVVNCEHEFGLTKEKLLNLQAGNPEFKRAWREDATQKYNHGSVCIHCNAWKGQYGLEPTPQMYV